jgi:hypothetical protein
VIKKEANVYAIARSKAIEESFVSSHGNGRYSLYRLLIEDSIKLKKERTRLEHAIISGDLELNEEKLQVDISYDVKNYSFILAFLFFIFQIKLNLKLNSILF